MSDTKISLGVIGCGGFGLFALQQFVQVPGVELRGMAGNERHCIGRGKQHHVYQQFELNWGEQFQKLPTYCQLLRRMLADQVAWLRNRSHQRRITEQNGRDSVAMVCAADRLAHQGGGAK